MTNEIWKPVVGYEGLKAYNKKAAQLGFLKEALNEF